MSDTEDFVDDAAFAEEVVDNVLSFGAYSPEELQAKRAEVIVWLLTTAPGRAKLAHMRKVDEIAPPLVPRVKRRTG